MTFFLIENILLFHNVNYPTKDSGKCYCRQWEILVRGVILSNYYYKEFNAVTVLDRIRNFSLRN